MMHDAPLPSETSPLPWSTDLARRMRPVSPIYGENYELHYGGVLDYHGKRILDIGASNGDTAWWFLDHEASDVLAVESEFSIFLDLLENSAGDPRVTAICAAITQPQHLEALILQWHPQIVKMDCEGDERLLLGCQPTVLQLVPEWVLEVHENRLSPEGMEAGHRMADAIMQRFTAHGWHVRKGPWTHHDSIYILYASSHPLPAPVHPQTDRRTEACMTCFVFTMNGTMTWGGGPISALCLIALQQQGHRILGGDDDDPGTLGAAFLSQGISLDAVPQHDLQQVQDARSQFPADRYIWVGSTPQDEEVAALSGFEYCPASIFMLNFAPLFTGAGPG